MNKEYDSLPSYINLAKRMISKFAPKFYKNLAYEMLNNEDAISDVANAIMTADWKYDAERTGKQTGKKKTKYSYRNQCAIWAIKTFITAKYKKNNSAISNYDSISIFEQDHKAKCPLDILTEAESDSLQKEYIQEILNSEILTTKQKEQIEMYYFNNKTLAEIGEAYGVTREAVRQNLLKGVKSIRSLCLQ